MTSPDPWLVLGLPPGSSLAEARAARRRLAKQLHPDLHTGGPRAEQEQLAARMTMVNQALAEIEGAAAGRGAGPGAAEAPGPAGSGAWARSPSGSAGSSGPAGWFVPAGPVGWKRAPAHATGPGDPDSFSVEYLPAEVFEALFLASYGLGDILVADEPYLLELYLAEPACFCRLSLVPEAGGTLVTVEVTPPDETDGGPEPSTVIEVLVAELNALVAG